MKHYIKCICAICNKQFYKFPSQIQKYCSKKCFNIGMKGHPAYWKGKKLPKEHIRKIREARIGKYQGSKNFTWKGGEISNNGYIMLHKPEHPFCDGKGYIRRSHLIMEKNINRYIKPEEVVHHINNIHSDDRIENLKLFPNKSSHIKFHYKISPIKFHSFTKPCGSP